MDDDGSYKGAGWELAFFSDFARILYLWPNHPLAHPSMKNITAVITIEETTAAIIPGL